MFCDQFLAFAKTSPHEIPQNCWFANINSCKILKYYYYQIIIIIIAIITITAIINLFNVDSQNMQIMCIVGDVSVGEVSVGEVSIGDVSVGEMSVGKMPGHP